MAFRRRSPGRPGRYDASRSTSSIMVSFKRPQVVSVEVTEVTARTPPPAFLFPNQQCQRPVHLPANQPFNARCRRRRLSSEPRIPCQIVSRRNFPTSSACQPRRLSAEPAASKEVTGASQAPFPKKKRSFPGAKYLEALANPFAFLGGRLLAKQILLVNRPFHFCLLGDQSRFRAQKSTEARRLVRRKSEGIRLRLRNLAIRFQKRKPRRSRFRPAGRGPEARGGF